MKRMRRGGSPQVARPGRTASALQAGRRQALAPAVAFLGIALFLSGCALNGTSPIAQSGAGDNGRSGGDALAVVVGYRSGIPDAPESLTVKSEVLGEDREVYVQLPPGYGVSNTRYPLLIVLDGEWLFHLVAAHARYYAFDEVTDEAIPPMIVVGLPNTDRDRDYTPTTGSGKKADFPTAGKARDFLRFLEGELIPLLDHRYRTLPGRGIVGWSFSGLFAAYTAVERPDLFSAHLCISPALWWDHEMTVDRLLAMRFERPKRMVLTLGAREAGGWVHEATTRLLERLDQKPVEKLAVSRFELEGVGHTWGVASAIDQGLRALFGSWIAPQEAIDEGMPAVTAYYERLSQEWGYQVAPPAKVLRAAAARRWSAGDRNQAMQILQTAVSDNPLDPLAHYDLGMMHRALGHNEDATESFQRAIRAEELKPVPNEVNLRQLREAMTLPAAQAGSSAAPSEPAGNSLN